METLDQQDAFSVDQFARRNGVGRTLVYQEIQEGRLIARKVRGRTLITTEDAKAWREQLPKVMPEKERPHTDVLAAELRVINTLLEDDGLVNPEDANGTD